MSSNEQLAIKGKIYELENQEIKLNAKIRGSAELLRGNCLLVLNDSYDQIDDQVIEVFSVELVKDIRLLRELKNKIKQLYHEIGQE